MNPLTPTRRAFSGRECKRAVKRLLAQAAANLPGISYAARAGCADESTSLLEKQGNERYDHNPHLALLAAPIPPTVRAYILAGLDALYAEARAGRQATGLEALAHSLIAALGPVLAGMGGSLADNHYDQAEVARDLPAMLALRTRLDTLIQQMQCRTGVTAQGGVS